MNTEVFWMVIGNYNNATWLIQIFLFLFFIGSIFLTYRYHIYHAPKLVLGVNLLFVGIVFCLHFGVEAIQKFFAAPLFIASGVLFLYEGTVRKEEKIRKFDISGKVLLIAVFLYPLLSILFGHQFPQMTTYIMPCPLVSFAILFYTRYEKKNKLLMILLIIWGLTGVKSMFFNVFEDLILLACGIYGIIHMNMGGKMAGKDKR